MKKPTISVYVNSDRGYDAYVCQDIGCEPITLFRANAPSEAKARELAVTWLAANPVKRQSPRKGNGKNYERDAETHEARHNERDYV